MKQNSKATDRRIGTYQIVCGFVVLLFLLAVLNNFDAFWTGVHAGRNDVFGRRFF